MTEIERLGAALKERYRVERELGQGGMATVYLAQDLRHDRKVAIKVLHPDLAAALGAQRFLHEIKTTAALQHPHILPLHDSGEADGLLFYVMPFVEGESLRGRLMREKPLPIGESVRIAQETASALDYAHRHGVIHRDIKPENILLHDGSALVADFGIALAVESAGGERMTQTGLSLGTPHYMSPEQAMGEKKIDARTDIYALGAVLYEMLSGDPPFTGSTVQAIVAKVMTERPTPLHTLRDTVPPGVEAATMQALAKLPADRFASAADFSAALSAPAATGATIGAARVGGALAQRLARTRAVAVALGCVAVIAIAAAVVAWRRGGTKSDAPVRRLELTVSNKPGIAYPTLGTVADLSLSPDGRKAVITVETTNGWALAVRDLDQLTAHVLAGTENSNYPAFSPDGKWIAFQGADGAIRKIGVDGSPLVTITPPQATDLGGLAWLSDREIIYPPQAPGTIGMYRVSAEGGTPAAFTPVDTTAERYELVPVVVDGGKVVVYTSTKGTADDVTLAAIRLSDHKVRIYSGIRAAKALGYVDGRLAYVRPDGGIMAVPFNTSTLDMGTPVQVGDSVAVRSWFAGAVLSADGTLLYQQGGSAAQLMRVGITGAETVLASASQQYLHPRFSPGGRQLAYEVVNGQGADIWTLDLASGATRRLTDGGTNDRPEWSADGKRVLYSSLRNARAELWWQPVDGSAPAVKIPVNATLVNEGVLTPDGRSLVYRIDTWATNRDVWMMPIDSADRAVPLVNSVYDEKQPRVSPDMKWLAYVSNESGPYEVYVRPLSPNGGHVPISAGGGWEPLWSADGRHVYYRSGESVIEATLSTTPMVTVTGRRTLFSGPYATDVYHADWDIAPDGQSFVMVRPTNDQRRLVLVSNWTAELRRRLGR